MNNSITYHEAFLPVVPSADAGLEAPTFEDVVAALRAYREQPFELRTSTHEYRPSDDKLTVGLTGANLLNAVAKQLDLEPIPVVLISKDCVRLFSTEPVETSTAALKLSRGRLVALEIPAFHSEKSYKLWHLFRDQISSVFQVPSPQRSNEPYFVTGDSFEQVLEQLPALCGH